jgi:post-segregation antitoxin (ccd killing protein)
VILLATKKTATEMNAVLVGQRGCEGLASELLKRSKVARLALSSNSETSMAAGQTQQSANIWQHLAHGDFGLLRCSWFGWMSQDFCTTTSSRWRKLQQKHEQITMMRQLFALQLGVSTIVAH